MQSHYSVIKELGRGAAGTVFLVRRRRDGRLFAAKEIISTSPDDRRAIMKEVHLLQAVPPHPNIIQLEEVVEQRGMVTVILEYAMDGTLKDRVYNGKPGQASGSVTEEDAVKWITQLVNAFEFIHAQGIVHRDIKLENLLLTSGASVVKISDFGVATNVLNQGKESLQRSTAGTPQYMSPEMCEGIPYTSKTDVWSLGIVAYEICTESLPFDADNLLGLVNRITKLQCPPLPSRFSRRLNAIVHAMLIKDPNRRPSMTDVSKMLKHYRQKKASGQPDGDDVGGFVVPESVDRDLEGIGEDMAKGLGGSIAVRTQSGPVADPGSPKKSVKNNSIWGSPSGDHGEDWGDDAIGFGEEPDLLGMLTGSSSAAPSGWSATPPAPSASQASASPLPQVVKGANSGGVPLADITNDQRRAAFESAREEAARNKARVLGEIHGREETPPVANANSADAVLFPDISPPPVGEKEMGYESQRLRQLPDDEEEAMRLAEEQQIRNNAWLRQQEVEQQRLRDEDTDEAEDEHARTKRLDAMRQELQQEFARQREMMEGMFRLHTAATTTCSSSIGNSHNNSIVRSGTTPLREEVLTASLGRELTRQADGVSGSPPLFQHVEIVQSPHNPLARPQSQYEDKDWAGPQVPVVRHLSYAERFPAALSGGDRRPSVAATAKTKFVQDALAEAEAEVGKLQPEGSSIFRPGSFRQPLRQTPPPPQPVEAGQHEGFADPSANTPSAVRKSVPPDRSDVTGPISIASIVAAKAFGRRSADRDDEVLSSVDDAMQTALESLRQSSHLAESTEGVSSVLTRLREMEVRQLQPVAVSVASSFGNAAQPLSSHPPGGGKQAEPAGAANATAAKPGTPASTTTAQTTISSDKPQPDLHGVQQMPGVSKAHQGTPTTRSPATASLVAPNAPVSGAAASTSSVPNAAMEMTKSARSASSDANSQQKVAQQAKQPGAQLTTKSAFEQPQLTSRAVPSKRTSPPPSTRKETAMPSITVLVPASGRRPQDPSSSQASKVQVENLSGAGVAPTAEQQRLMFPLCYECQRKRKEASQRSAASPAVLYCASCNQPYCTECSAALHRGLKSPHQIFQLGPSSRGGSDAAQGHSSASTGLNPVPTGGLRRGSSSGDTSARLPQEEEESNGSPDEHSRGRNQGCCCSVM
jgi:serine/threonine protein kinase